MSHSITKQKLPYWQLFLLSFKDAYKSLQANDPLRLAGATAFFTTFALPAILVILIQLLRLIFRMNHPGRRLSMQLESMFGVETADAIVQTLRAFRSIAQNWVIGIAGFLFLLFVATTLFKIIKGSINELWRIRPVQKADFRQIMLSRLRGVLVIVFAGILFLIDVVAEAAKAFLGRYISAYLPALDAYYNSTLNYVMSVVWVTIWFYLVFYFIPDGRPRLKPGLVGALVTGILFTIGKIVLKVMLTYSSINTLYGASASTVLLLLFMFYSSIIFYFGAAFTNEWSSHIGQPIRTMHHAMRYELKTTEEEG